MVAERETAGLAGHLIGETCPKHGVQPQVLTLHFKTVKYHPGFPGRFGSIEEAKDLCREFFLWYNTQHRHGGIGLLTPEQVHLGHAPAVIEHRQKVLAAAYAARPDRFVGGPPRAAELPDEVWINRALPVTAVDEAESANGGKEGSLN